MLMIYAKALNVRSPFSILIHKASYSPHLLSSSPPSYIGLKCVVEFAATPKLVRSIFVRKSVVLNFCLIHGVATLIGVSSLLLTRQSASALAVDLVGSKPTVSTAPATTEAAPIPVTAPSTAVIPSKPINLQFLAHRPANESINSEFRLTQAAETLQPAINKQPLTKKNSPIPATARQSVETAPMNVGDSEAPQSVRGRQVFPELPPLGAVDTYLPKPVDTSASFKSYIWPAKGVVTSGYGWRWGRMHKGIDIAAATGTPIVAAAPGIVLKAGWNSGGYGKLVDIKHSDGTFTRYAHNNQILVQAGQQVKQGQQIAEMGSTGRSSGLHSHFEFHLANKGAVNPIAYLPQAKR